MMLADFIKEVVLILFSGVLIPAVPMLIITWYRSRRNEEKIDRLFIITDELQKDKAERRETDLRIRTITEMLQQYAIQQSGNIARFEETVKRFEATEKRFEAHINSDKE